MGFKYRGYKDKTWLFINEDKEVVQEILIEEYRYDSSYYTFMLSGTSAIPASMLDSSEKLLGEYWKAKTEDEFKELLLLFLKLIESRGVDLLEDVCVPDYSYKVLSVLSKVVYENHNIIFEEFERKYPYIPTEEYSIQNIET